MRFSSSHTQILNIFLFCFPRFVYTPLNWREVVFLIIENPDYNLLSKLVSVVLLILILTSSIVFVVETLKQFQIEYVDGEWRSIPNALEPRLMGEAGPEDVRIWISIFTWIELVSTVSFTIEYLLRLVGCTGTTFIETEKQV